MYEAHSDSSILTCCCMIVPFNPLQPHFLLIFIVVHIL